ncbi:MAG: capsular biosynthesis protein [Proteobacteria bacterium]|nr:capsular biosynthesis protein [Pseudomonadota bacterium]HQR04688.1 capsular biosynthesis protein [Rhodocyclaceae bacterium]
MTSKPHFLFLQGMPCSFFSRIAKGLEALGCRATGVNFCIGDAIFWRGPNTVNFRGRLSEWPEYLEDFIVHNQVTDLVLLGEQRSYHRPAVGIAQAHGLRVTVTDFGYLRPDWITLERDGMTGNSQFPRDPQQIRTLAASLPEPDWSRQFHDSSWRMAIADFSYNLGNLLLWFTFPHYRRSDKRPPTIFYTLSSAKRLLTVRMGKRGMERKIGSLVDSGCAYFVFPLQLEHDFQIVAYSPFCDLAEAVRLVIGSFAAHADQNARLVIKVHPWDPGLRDWREVVSRIGAEFGIEGRIDLFDGGNLDDLIRHSRGMVTVNSTSGVRALQMGSRVMTLGQAVYNVQGITYPGTLDTFWTDGWQPDAGMVHAFFRAMAGTIQIRGVFFAEPGLSTVVQESVSRLYSGTVGMPSASLVPMRRGA